MPYTRVEQDHSKKILIQNPSSLLFGNNLALFASELCTTKYPECLKFSHCHGSCMVPGTITGLQTKLIELADICPPLECPEEPDLRVSGPCLICPKSISQRMLPVKEQEAAYLSEHIEIGKKKKWAQKDESRNRNKIELLLWSSDCKFWRMSMCWKKSLLGLWLYYCHESSGTNSFA